MAFSRRLKLKLLDTLHEELDRLTRKDVAAPYIEYLGLIRKELTKLIKQGVEITPSIANRIVKDIIVDIDQDTLDKITLINTILAAVDLYITNQNNLTVKDKKSLAPIIGLLAVASIRRPKKLAKVISSASRSVINNNAMNKDVKVENSAYSFITKYGKQKEKLLGALSKEYINDFNKTKKLTSRTNIRQIIKLNSKYRNSLKDPKDYKNDKAAEFVFKNIKVDNIEDNNIKRIMNTEIPRQQQTAALANAIEEEYTLKTWISERDSRVRKDHTKLDNGKYIGIKELFKVGSTMALRPRDPNLPLKQSAGCRCRLGFKRG